MRWFFPGKIVTFQALSLFLHQKVCRYFLEVSRKQLIRNALRFWKKTVFFPGLWRFAFPRKNSVADPSWKLQFCRAAFGHFDKNSECFLAELSGRQKGGKNLRFCSKMKKMVVNFLVNRLKNKGFSTLLENMVFCAAFAPLARAPNFF